MHWQYVPYVLPLSLAAAIGIVLALFMWRRRAAPGALALMALIAAAAMWSLGYALEWAGPDLASKLFWAKVQYLGIATIPLAWLAFAFQYTGRDHWLTGPTLALLGVIPSITVLLVWTNAWHGLVWSRTELSASGPFLALGLTHGLWFWVYWAFSYLLLLLGSMQLLWMLPRFVYMYRWQVGVALIGVLLPWVGNGLYVSGLGPVPNLDLTPLSFIVSGVAFAYGLLHYRLLDILPLARQAILDSMNDGVMVLDTRERIVDLNPAIQHLIGLSRPEVVGKSVADVLADRAELIQVCRDVAATPQEITLWSDPLRTRFNMTPQSEEAVAHHYEVRTWPVADRNQRLLGRVVMWHDITARKQAEAALRAAHDGLERRVQERTQELSRANQALQAEITERTRTEQALKESEAQYRLLAEHVTDVIWATDLSLGFTYVSPSVFALCGYNAEEIMSQSIDEVLTPASTQLAMQALVTELEREKSFAAPDPARSVIMELEQICRGGSTVPIEIKVTFLRDAAGQPVGVLGVTRDITERKRAEELLRASLREKEVLLKEIHHRVKNNLQVVSSLLSLQAAHIPDALALEVFQEAQRRVRSMALVHEKLYRSENLARVDFAEYIRDLCSFLFDSYSAGALDIDLDIQAESLFLDVSLAVPCGLILNELISNSLKHAFPPVPERPGSQTGQIRIELHADLEGQATLIVGDNGVGFAPAVDFRQMTSLGLQLVNILVDQLGGAIELDQSHGTQFRIKFLTS